MEVVVVALMFVVRSSAVHSKFSLDQTNVNTLSCFLRRSPSPSNGIESNEIGASTNVLSSISQKFAYVCLLLFRPAPMGCVNVMKALFSLIWFVVNSFEWKSYSRKRTSSPGI